MRRRRSGLPPRRAPTRSSFRNFFPIVRCAAWSPPFPGMDPSAFWKFPSKSRFDRDLFRRECDIPNLIPCQGLREIAAGSMGGSFAGRTSQQSGCGRVLSDALHYETHEQEEKIMKRQLIRITFFAALTIVG